MRSTIESGQDQAELLLDADDDRVDAVEDLVELAADLRGVVVEVELLEPRDRVAVAEAVDQLDDAVEDLLVLGGVLADAEQELADALDHAAGHGDEGEAADDELGPLLPVAARGRLLDHLDDRGSDVADGGDVADDGDHADHGVDDQLAGGLLLVEVALDQAPQPVADVVDGLRDRTLAHDFLCSSSIMASMSAAPRASRNSELGVRSLRSKARTSGP
jgi:hypothetical protein